MALTGRSVKGSVDQHPLSPDNSHAPPTRAYPAHHSVGVYQVNHLQTPGEQAFSAISMSSNISWKLARGNRRPGTNPTSESVTGSVKRQRCARTATVVMPPFVIPLVLPVTTSQKDTLPVIDTGYTAESLYGDRQGFVRTVLLHQREPYQAHILLLRKKVPGLTGASLLTKYLHSVADVYCSWWLPILLKALCPVAFCAVIHTCTKRVQGVLNNFDWESIDGQLTICIETLSELTRLTNTLLNTADDALVAEMLDGTPDNGTDCSAMWAYLTSATVDNLVNDIIATDSEDLLARHNYTVFTHQQASIQQGLAAYQTLLRTLTHQIEYCINFGVRLSLRGMTDAKLRLTHRCTERVKAVWVDARFTQVLEVAPFRFPHRMVPVLLAYPVGASMGVIVDMDRLPRAMMTTTVLEVHQFPTALAALVVSYIKMDAGSP
jgi:hypothetical protein